jgi:hypothetical protein
MIGSYPTFDPTTGFTTNVVLRSREEGRLESAEAAVIAMLEEVRDSEALA